MNSKILTNIKTMLNKTKTNRQIEADAQEYADRVEDLALPILCALIGRMPSSTEEYLPNIAVKMAKNLISEINSTRVEHGQMLQRANNLKLK
jgi:hypothetical protein